MKNPRDGRFKNLGEGPTELLLRELQLDAVQMDHAYRIGEEILHLEAISRSDCRVRSFVILMSERHAPRNLPERLSIRRMAG